MYVVVEVLHMIKLLLEMNDQQQIVFMLQNKDKPKIKMKKERQIQWSQGQENAGLQLKDEYKPNVKLKKGFSFLILFLQVVLKRLQGNNVFSIQ